MRRAVSRRGSGFNGQLGGAHDGPALDLGKAAELDIPRDRGGESDVLEGGIVLPTSAGEWLAPVLAVLRDADLKISDPAVGRVLSWDGEEPFGRARGAEVDDELMRIAGHGSDEFSMPDRVEVAIAGLAGLISRRKAVGRESLAFGLGSGRRGFADPIEYRAIGRMLCVLPPRPADMGQ